MATAKANIVPLEIPCCGCNRPVIVKGNFMPNHNEFHEYKLMNYCNACCKEISNKMMDSAYNYEVGVRNICSFFDMPFVNEAMLKVQSKEEKRISDKNWNYVNEYGKALSEIEYPKDKWNDLSGNNLWGLDLLKNTTGVKDGDIELLQGLEKDWGKQDTLNDYLILEEKFEEHTKGEELSTSTALVMRYLCLAELEVMKAKNNKEDSKIAEEKVMKYLKALKLDNFMLNESKDVVYKTLEYWTAIEETTRPLEVADELFKEDICGLKEGYKEMLRCVDNATGNTEKFPEEI